MTALFELFFLAAAVCAAPADNRGTPALAAGQPAQEAPAKEEPPPLPEATPLKLLHGHSQIAYAAAFSPDGKLLATGGVDNTVKLWDTASWTELLTLRGHAGFVNALAFSPDSKELVSAGEDGDLRLWDAATGACLAVMKGHRDGVLAAVFFPDGKTIASGGMDGKLRLWKTGSRRPSRTLPAQNGYLNALAVSPDGKLLASGGLNRVIKIWDTASWKVVSKLEGHPGQISALAFSPFGDHLASGGEEGSVRVWRLSDGLCQNNGDNGAPVLALAYSPDGTHLFSGGGGNRALMRDLGTYEVTMLFPEPGQVRALAVSPDGKYLVSAGADKAVRLWLTPNESAAREVESAATTQRKQEYAERFNNGVRLAAGGGFIDLAEARFQLGKALAISPKKECSDKLAEVDARIAAELRTWMRRALPILAAALVLLMLRGALEKRRLLRSLPDSIKRNTLGGSSEGAFTQLETYKSMGGDMSRLHPDELLELYKTLRRAEDLAREKLPAAWLLKYAEHFAADGNNRLAAAMLRGGMLADCLRTPGEFEGFVSVFEKIARPEDLLAPKLSPAAYSGLAEAFLKAGNKDYCVRMCGLKQSHHPKAMTARDRELLTAGTPVS